MCVSTVCVSISGEYPQIFFCKSKTLCLVLYSFKLETHTVETHIYRLRKKIKDQFNDDNFITSHDAGYLI